jgi:hypothetical protein
MVGFIGGLIIGLVVAVVGVYLTWSRGKKGRETALEIPDAQARAAKLEATIAQLENEKKKDDKKKAGELADAQAKATKLEVKVAQLQAEQAKDVKKRADESADARADVVRLEAKVAQLEDEKKRGDGKKGVELVEAQTRIAQLEARILQIEQEKGKLEREKNALQQDTNTLEKQTKRLEDENKHLQLEKKELEQEKNKWQLLERFTPRIVVGGMPPNNQFIKVTDSATFRVVEMDYLSANGLKVSGQVVDRAGQGVQIPIDESKVTEVQKLGCDPGDGSFSMSFRIHIEVDGMTKPFLLSVRVAVNSKLSLEPMPLGTMLKR